MIVPPGAEHLEDGMAALVAADDLTVEHERGRPERAGGIDDGGVSIGPVVPVASEQPHARAVALHLKPKTVVLDFVYPVRPGRR
jgi:hypothetical protein